MDSFVDVYSYLARMQVLSLHLFQKLILKPQPNETFDNPGYLFSDRSTFDIFRCFPPPPQPQPQTMRMPLSHHRRYTFSLSRTISLLKTMLLLPLLTSLFLCAATTAHARTTTSNDRAAARDVKLTFTLPPQISGHSLPASTTASLLTAGKATQTAHLQRAPRHRFTFRNLTEGEYVLLIHCPEWIFAPYRVDVGFNPAERASATAAAGSGKVLVGMRDRRRG